MTGFLFVLLAYMVMISIIVVVHEFGHYSAARAFGLVATHFSLGFGPKLFGVVDRHGTEWRVSPFLFGGYVKFPGDDASKPAPEGILTLERLARWKRAIVVGAGPGINLLAAALLFSAIAWGWGYPVGRPDVLKVIPNTPAAAVGIRKGDVVTDIGGKPILVATDVTQSVVLHPGMRTVLGWKSNGIHHSAPITIAARTIYDEDRNPARIGYIGVLMPQSFQRATGPIDAVTHGVADGWFMTYAQGVNMVQIVSGERSVHEMSGPIKIAKMSAKTMSLGLMPFLWLMAVVSIAIGVVNLLPVPGLDGGHLATYAVETLIRRDVPDGVKTGLAKAGLAFALCLGLFAVYLDLTSIPA